jgi:hypothetical protein
MKKNSSLLSKEKSALICDPDSYRGCAKKNQEIAIKTHNFLACEEKE